MVVYIYIHTCTLSILQSNGIASIHFSEFSQVPTEMPTSPVSDLGDDTAGSPELPSLQWSSVDLVNSCLIVDEDWSMNSCQKDIQVLHSVLATIQYYILSSW